MESFQTPKRQLQRQAARLSRDMEKAIYEEKRILQNLASGMDAWSALHQKRTKTDSCTLAEIKQVPSFDENSTTTSNRKHPNVRTSINRDLNDRFRAVSDPSSVPQKLKPTLDSAAKRERLRQDMRQKKNQIHAILGRLAQGEMGTDAKDGNSVGSVDSI